MGQGIPQSDPSSQQAGLLSLEIMQNLVLGQQAVALISRPESSFNLELIWGNMGKLFTRMFVSRAETTLALQYFW